ncbi:MAG TPA: Calx-beta domain-containing protein, partial [Pyrinomonadaceae bacterium]|nr:Calx-beta domain-containing protein [Pyrinomonadaceae bacterium]
MTNPLPLTNVSTTVFTKLNLRMTRARLLALILFVGLLSTVALSASSTASLRHLLFANRGEAASTAGAPSTWFTRVSRSVLRGGTPTECALNIARRGHSATLLKNSKILIAGGENQNGLVTEAEIFDPATRTFSVSGNLNIARADHSATPLSDGRVLIAGGRGAVGILNSTEIFDPVSGAFINGPTMNSARAGHTATTFADGRIVFAGGDNRGTIEIYDSSTNAFTSLSVTLASPRAFHGAALLNDGRILIIGGTAPDGSDVKSGEVLAIADDNIVTVGDTEDEHIRPLLRLLPDGKVQIIGGSDHEVMEIYDPAVNQLDAHAHVFPIGDSHPELLQQIMDAPTRAALFRLGSTDVVTNRARHTITELSGSKDALIAGGVDSNGTILATVSIVNSSSATITTDKLDYAPGTQVIVSGAGFQPNEIVTLTFHEDPHVDAENPHTFTVQADANGNFTCQEYAPEDEDGGLTYILAATGGSSGWTAQTALTDGVPPKISLIALDTSACENFNTLAITSTSSTTPDGWTFAESGTSANTTYAAGTGSSATGDTYSFGAASNTERAFGGLRTGSLVPIIGAAFTNNTGRTITSFVISYTGEQWRLGTSGRAPDKLDFQYSTTAGSLTDVVTWTDIDALDFSSPVTTGTVGALNGNSAANRTAISHTITGLSIPNGAAFWIRWTDFDVSSSDDGLAIDDFCLIPQGLADVSVAVSPAAVEEDGATNLVYTFTRSNTSGGALTVNFSVGGDATFNTDYTQSGADSFSSSAGTVTFGAGQSTATVTIDPTADNILEPNEPVLLTVATGAGYNVGSPSSAMGTITEADHELSINATTTVTEGNSGSSNMTFTVTLSPASTQTVTVDYSTANGTTNPALGGGACGGMTDYVSQSGTLTFTPGQTVKTIDVPICGDTRDEPDETLTVTLDTPSNATIAAGQGTSDGTITDDDAMPTISINDVSVNEDNSGTTAFNFTVSLSNPSQGTITVEYATQDNSATAPSDYAAITTTTLTFNPDETSKNATVVVNGDTVFEPNETFLVNLTNSSSNSILAFGTKGTGTITNDDTPPTVQFASASSSGAESTSLVNLQVTLSNASYQTVTVNYSVNASSTATGGGADYTWAAGPLTFNPGETNKQISLAVNDDNLNENDETVVVDLTSSVNANIGSLSSHTYTIQDNDAAPSFSIEDVTHNEGNSGTTSYTFTVTKTGATDLAASVNFATANSAASAGSDYTATSGMLTFGSAEDSKTLTVLVNGDTTYENNETFFVNLSDANNATISDEQGVGMITNDDTEPTLSIVDVILNEDNSGTTSFTFSVTKSGATELPSTVNYQTIDGTALQPGDYQSKSGTLTFAANELTKQITVLVVGDTTYETNEAFTVKLSNASGASIGDDEGLGTITNDDAAPNFAVNDVTMNEGTGPGPTTFIFTITKTGATEVTATVDFVTANGTMNPATGGSVCGSGVDYASSNGLLTFAANETTKTATVNVCR